MKTNLAINILLVTCLDFAAGASFAGPLPEASRPDEAIASVVIDGTTYKNVRVVRATPVDLLIRLENGGALTLKRQELPAELKEKYPFNPTEAATYQEGRAASARAAAEWDRNVILGELLRQEYQLNVRIRWLHRELDALQKQLDVMRAQAQGRRPASPYRQALDHARERKLDLLQQVKRLEDLREAYRQRQLQYQ